MRRIPFALSVMALLVALIALVQVAGQNRPKEASTPKAPPVEREHLELAVQMGHMQRFHQKLWEAGKAGNTELAGFYLHEMEEAMETIARAGIIDEGVDVSSNMGVYGLDVVEGLARKLKDEGVRAMHADADLLANSCTSCHTVCGHPYIRIVTPMVTAYPDQDFSPVHK